jgi:hypothetical protein
MAWLLGLLPTPETLDAVLLVLFVGPVALLGVPVLRASIRVPRRMEIVQLADGELPPRVREYFERIESRLRTEGFNPIATFSVVNLPAHNVNRAYLSAGDPAVALATVGSVDRDGVTVGARYLEFVTEFADGTTVNTRSAAIDDPFDLLPGYHRYVHPRISDPLVLKQEHAAHCEPFAVKEAQHCDPAAMLDRLRAYHLRWITHQEDRGLLRRLRGDDVQDGATVRLALRGIASFFNPFAEGFTTSKFLLALALGFAAPVLAITALDRAELPVVSSLMHATGLAEPLVRLLVMAPILLAGAAAAGWIFTGHALLWGFLVTYASSRLVLPAGLDDDLARAVWIGTLLAAPAVAQRVETFRNRARSR